MEVILLNLLKLRLIEYTYLYGFYTTNVSYYQYDLEIKDK